MALNFRKRGKRSSIPTQPTEYEKMESKQRRGETIRFALIAGMAAIVLGGFWGYKRIAAPETLSAAEVTAASKKPIVPAPAVRSGSLVKSTNVVAVKDSPAKPDSAKLVSLDYLTRKRQMAACDFKANHTKVQHLEGVLAILRQRNGIHEPKADSLYRSCWFKTVHYADVPKIVIKHDTVPAPASMASNTKPAPKNRRTVSYAGMYEVPFPARCRYVQWSTHPRCK